MSNEKTAIFVISDTHFDHKNIISYTNRPFKTVEEMNKILIDNWNSVVGPDDIVIHCGDFCMTNKRTSVKKYAEQLNGRKFIVLGNHDSKRVPFLDCGFCGAARNYIIIGDKIFCHNKEKVPPQKLAGRYTYYGHVHNKDATPLTDSSRNVCVELIDYRPLNITSDLTEFEYSSILRYFDLVNGA